MSLPPLNSESTASGIIIDPRTLERVIPATRRKDGSLRKEQKIRKGYIPQEDVGAFRSRRQLEAESRRSVVPGSSRPPKQPSTQPGAQLGAQPGAQPSASKPDNPFAQEKPPLTKAAAKNEKRKAKRTTDTGIFRPSRNWDSDSDGDDSATAEALRSDFGRLKLDRNDESAFPPLGASSAATGSNSKTHSRSGSVSPVKQSVPSSPAKPAASVPSPPKSVWAKPADVAGAVAPVKGPLPAAPPPAPTPAPQPARVTSPTPSDAPSNASWRRGANGSGSGRRGRGGGSGGGGSSGGGSSSSGSSYQHFQAQNNHKPHPIQGGRQGPIGLAFPPPIDEYAKRPSPSVRGSSRASSRSHHRGSGASDRSGGSGSSARSTPTPGAGAAAAGAAEPRVRREVRVREGGPLADRVRSLLLQNQASDRPRRAHAPKAAEAEQHA